MTTDYITKSILYFIVYFYYYILFLSLWMSLKEELQKLRDFSDTNYQIILFCSVKKVNRYCKAKGKPEKIQNELFWHHCQSQNIIILPSHPFIGAIIISTAI